jgi:hypothetical protein
MVWVTGFEPVFFLPPKQVPYQARRHPDIMADRMGIEPIYPARQAGISTS